MFKTETSFPHLKDGELVKQITEKAVTFYRCLGCWKTVGLSFAEEPAITGKKSYVPNGIIF